MKITVKTLTTFLLLITIIQQPNNVNAQSKSGQIKSIYRVNSASSLGGKSGIEIEIFSNRAFPIVSALPILQIGKSIFKLSRHPESGRNTIIFILTEQEFKNLKNNSSSLVKYDPDSQGTWNIGKLNKKMLTN